MDFDTPQEQVETKVVLRSAADDTRPGRDRSYIGSGERLLAQIPGQHDNASLPHAVRPPTSAARRQARDAIMNYTSASQAEDMAIVENRRMSHQFCGHPDRREHPRPSRVRKECRRPSEADAYT